MPQKRKKEYHITTHNGAVPSDLNSLYDVRVEPDRHNDLLYLARRSGIRRNRVLGVVVRVAPIVRVKCSQAGRRLHLLDWPPSKDWRHTVLTRGRWVRHRLDFAAPGDVRADVLALHVEHRIAMVASSVISIVFAHRRHLRRELADRPQQGAALRVLQEEEQHQRLETLICKTKLTHLEMCCLQSAGKSG